MSALKQIVALGVTGPARVGKDTISKLVKETLEQSYNYRVAIMPLAGALKDECAETLGIHRSWFDDPKYKEHLRPLMQWWGTEYRRNEALGGDDMYWCDFVAQKAQEADIDILIVSDVRFDNEALWVYETFGDGLVLAIQSEDFKGTEHTSHASEQGVSMDNIAMGFTNNHSEGLEALKPYIDWIAGTVHTAYQNLWDGPVPTDEQMYGTSI